jgi:hypothetical protein
MNLIVFCNGANQEFELLKARSYWEGSEEGKRMGYSTFTDTNRRRRRNLRFAYINSTILQSSANRIDVRVPPPWIGSAAEDFKSLWEGIYIIITSRQLKDTFWVAELMNLWAGLFHLSIDGRVGKERKDEIWRPIAESYSKASSNN